MRNIDPESPEMQKAHRENEAYKLSLQYIPCKFCGSPVSIYNETHVCSDCELQIQQESQVS